MPSSIAVAGGAGGLGAAICHALANRGHHVLIGYQSNAGRAASLAESIQRSGNQAAIFKVDLREARQVEDFLDTARRLGDGLAGVVNATGPAIPLRPLTEIDPGLFQQIMRTDVEGAFNLLTAAGRRLADQGGGAVVQLLTTAVLRTLENDAMSGIPKTAISGVVRQLARELGPRNVRFNGIAPGVIDAGIVHDSFTADAVAKAVIADCLAKTPMPRMGRPEEVAALATYLLGDEASYINGQIIAIDGGYSA